MVKIVVLRAYGEKIGVVDFGDAVRVEEGAAETAAKWGKGDLRTRSPREEVVL